MSGPGSSYRPVIEAPLEFRLRSGGAPSKGSSFVTCPKCEAPCFIRRSTRITVLVKELTAHCTNSGCGHIFDVQVCFVHSLVPGLIDRPDLHLQVCPREKVAHVFPPSGRDADGDQISMFGGPS
jgi:hypothetical protein